MKQYFSRCKPNKLLHLPTDAKIIESIGSRVTHHAGDVWEQACLKRNQASSTMLGRFTLMKNYTEC